MFNNYTDREMGELPEPSAEVIKQTALAGQVLNGYLWAGFTRREAFQLLLEAMKVK